MTPMRTLVRHAAVLLLLQIACARAGVAGEIVKVNINDLAFSPAEITIKPGDTIEWVNADFIDHTATARGGSWDVVITAGKSAKRQFNKPGTSTYYCRFHPSMTGVIHVRK
jgi:plastocyanin